MAAKQITKVHKCLQVLPTFPGFAIVQISIVYNLIFINYKLILHIEIINQYLKKKSKL
jgi:hypothetical protein